MIKIKKEEVNYDYVPNRDSVIGDYLCGKCHVEINPLIENYCWNCGEKIINPL